MTWVFARLHPGWTPELLLRLAVLAEGDAAYLDSLRRPWRVPAPAVLSDDDVTGAVENLAYHRARRTW